MWDRPEALSTISSLLFGVFALGLLYIGILVTVHSPLFPVREVVITGSISRVTPTQIDNVVHRELRGTFFTINLDASRLAFEKLPWVRKVQVRRQWPDRLEVTLEEHAVLARWRQDGLVNTHGEIFTAASDDPLPVFSGPPELAGDMATNYAAFDRALAPLGRRVQDIRVSERRAWTVQLEDGMTLELGRERVVERLSKFADAYVTSVGLMKEPPRMVDLRYPNGFAVRLKTVNKGA
ncbi:MAG: cell division protein FtsQ/DivIB [Betaproteobacteria bacterium]|nr:cell division protein FtsQ/DivIB [Betaproteobacteria bacterium]